MADDIYNDILFRLRVPLPYELRGLTVQDLMTERKDAADEIERLREERLELWHLINNIDRTIHKGEPVNPWWHDRIVLQQSKQWPSLWEQIRRACTDYLKVNPRG